MTKEDGPSRQAQRFSLTGRIAVVTGGHRGIGRDISLGIAYAGGDVIVVDRNGPCKSDVPSLIEAVGRRHASIRADLGCVNDVLQAAKMAKTMAEGWGGRVDTLVNNAAISELDNLERMETEMWDSTMAVNLRAPMLFAREFAAGKDGMLAKGGGVIVNVTSVAARTGIPEHSAYSSSKAGLEMLTRSMATEWASQGIRANVVAPTVVFTSMGRAVWQGNERGREMIKRLPAGRFAEPEEISDVVVFLCSDAAAMIHGTIIPVDGGHSAM